MLRRRPGLRAAFVGFEPARLARLGEADVVRLLADPRVIRHPQKVRAAISNARAALALARAGTDLSAALWGFVDGQPQQPRRRRAAEVPTLTPASTAMSRWLRGHGFSFCGPTICYAFMQATGMVNDHLVSCRRHRELATAP